MRRTEIVFERLPLFAAVRSKWLERAVVRNLLLVSCKARNAVLRTRLQAQHCDQSFDVGNYAPRGCEISECRQLDLRASDVVRNIASYSPTPIYRSIHP